jgi:hypothetical protein
MLSALMRMDVLALQVRKEKGKEVTDTIGQSAGVTRVRASGIG